MSKDIWFISDTHFGHANSLKWLDDDGNPIRGHLFESAEEMDEVMVQNWNSVVKQYDKVYHLGDVVIPHASLPILGKLNGKKRLVRGNHDIYKTKQYAEYFQEIYGIKVFPDLRFVCTHVPIHPLNLYRWKLNVHGHMHDNPMPEPNHQYFNVCVENHNYTPVHLDEILMRIAANEHRSDNG